jgi:hypothetical protein
MPPPLSTSAAARRKASSIWRSLTSFHVRENPLPYLGRPRLLDRVRTHHQTGVTRGVGWLGFCLRWDGSTRTREGSGIRAGQELLDHRVVSTTMIYAQVFNRGWGGVRSAADRLLRS